MLLGVGSDDFTGLAVLGGMRQNPRLPRPAGDRAGGHRQPRGGPADRAPGHPRLHAEGELLDHRAAHADRQVRRRRLGGEPARPILPMPFLRLLPRRPRCRRRRALGRGWLSQWPLFRRGVLRPANPAKRLFSGGGGAVTTPEDDRKALTAAAGELNVPLLTREQMLERVNAAKIRTLPGAVAQLVSLVSSPRGTVADVAKVLKHDPVLSARVLQVANSAAYAAPHQHHQCRGGGQVHRRGRGAEPDRIRRRVRSCWPAAGRRSRRCWQHSLAVAALMEKLTPAGEAAPPGTPYVVGLCHDLSDIILRQYFAEEYAPRPAVRRGTPAGRSARRSGSCSACPTTSWPLCCWRGSGCRPSSPRRSRNCSSGRRTSAPGAGSVLGRCAADGQRLRPRPDDRRQRGRAGGAADCAPRSAAPTAKASRRRSTTRYSAVRGDHDRRAALGDGEASDGVDAAAGAAAGRCGSATPATRNTVSWTPCWPCCG